MSISACYDLDAPNLRRAGRESNGGSAGTDSNRAGEGGSDDGGGEAGQGGGGHSARGGGGGESGDATAGAGDGGMGGTSGAGASGGSSGAGAPGGMSGSAGRAGAGGSGGSGAACGAEWVPCEPRLWPEGRIPYEFADDSDPALHGGWDGTTNGVDPQAASGPEDRAQILEAMAEWQSATFGVIRFEPASDDETRYVSFSNRSDAGCGTIVPQNARVTSVRLRRCGAAAIRHTLGHVIGVSHEHQRMDRDRYVEIGSAICAPPDPPGQCAASEPMVNLPLHPVSGSYCGFNDYSAYRAHRIAEQFPKCHGQGAAEFGPFNPSSVMLATSTPNAEVSPGDASAVVQLYKEPAFTRFRPIVRAETPPNQPLDLELVSGVSVIGSPAISRWGNTGVVAVARGSDHHFYVKYNPDGTTLWPVGDWTDVGGDFSSDPAVVSWAERRLDLFGITAEGTLVHRSMVDGVWMTDEDLGRPGPSIPSAPAVVSAAAERLSVFVRSDLNLFQRSWTIAGWDAWLDLGGDFSGKPATAARFPATIDLVGAAITGGEVWGKTSQLGAWTPYFDPIHGIAAPGTGPALTSLGGSDVLNMEIADQRGMLWHGRFDYRGWTSFEPVGGQPQGSPAAVQLQTGEGHTLIVMIDQGRPGIWHRIWN